MRLPTFRPPSVPAPLAALPGRLAGWIGRTPLLTKILFATVIVPMVLIVSVIGVINRGMSERALADMHEDLQRTALLLESTLSARSEALTMTAGVIVRDPRFFATLSLPGSASDRWYRTTVRDVADDFHEVADTDLFEVLDRKGRLVASVGRHHTSDEGRAWIANEAASGRRVGIVIEDARQWQVTLTPISVHDRRVGTLVLGTEIGATLATDLQKVTQSDVSFVIDGAVTGTTLEPDLVVAAGLTDPNLLVGDPDGPSAPEVVHAGEHTLLTLARGLPGAPAGSRTYYVMQRSLEAEMSTLQRLRTTLVQLGVAAVLAALAIGLFVSTRITRPILQVVRGAEEMERGNYDHPIETYGQDELGYLANRFTMMRRHEQVYVNSLQEVARLKSEFISVASHELRTPVSVIRGYSEMFASGRLGPLTDEQRRVLSVIDEHVNGLARIAEDATRVAQIEGERMVLFRDEQDVGRIVEDAAASALAGAREREVEVTVEVGTGLDAVHVDGPRLLQAVLQLVRNGIRFTPDGGRVEVSAAREHGMVVIDVVDTGVGIPEPMLPRLFDRVVTVRDSLRHHSSNTLEFNSAGLGLGLSIARGIVEAHGGELRVESTPGTGSRFTISIPLDPSALPRPAA